MQTVYDIERPLKGRIRQLSVDLNEQYREVIRLRSMINERECRIEQLQFELAEVKGWSKCPNVDNRSPDFGIIKR